MAAFRGTDGRVLAARLVWEGRLTGAQVAAACGVCRQALDKWKARPEFRARLQQYRDEHRACLRQEMRAQWAKELDEAVRAVQIGPPPRRRRPTR